MTTKMRSDMSSREKAIDAAKKLLRVTAENGSSVQEVATAAKILQATLEKHQLSAFDLKAQRLHEDILQEEFETGYKHLPHTFISLGNSVCRAFDCKLILSSYWNKDLRKHCAKMIIIGTKSDADIAVYFIMSLHSQLRDMAHEEGRRIGYTHSDLQDYKKSFIMGAGEEIRRRLKAEREIRAETNENVFALVRVKSHAVSSYVADKFPDLRKGSRINYGTGSGYGDGKRAGKKIQLTKGVRGSQSSSRQLEG